MSDAAATTRDALIEAAGELFAAHGYDGASVRAIAQRAGANLAAVSYHFGSKEGLFRAVLRQVASDAGRVSAADYLARAREHPVPGHLAEVLSRFMVERFQAYFGPGEPLWHAQVLMRSFLQPTPALEEVVRDFFQPETDALAGLVALARPEWDPLEARLLVHGIEAPFCFYCFARAPLLMVLGRDEYDDHFIQAAAVRSVRTVLAALDLPEPEWLNAWTLAPAEAGADDPMT